MFIVVSSVGVGVRWRCCVGVIPGLIGLVLLEGHDVDHPQDAEGDARHGQHR